MATISLILNADNSVSYAAQVRMKGVKRFKTFTRKLDAATWAADVEREIRLGKQDAIRQSEIRTFLDVINKYCTEELPFLSSAVQRQRNQQLQWWAHTIGNCKLSELSAERISAARAKLQVHDNSTVNRYCDVLRRVLTVAVKSWRWLQVNPMQFIDRLKESPGRLRWLADHERDSLLNCCKEVKCKQLYPIVVLTLSTGPRKSEIRNIKWSDYDRERSRVYLDKTKNGERRSVLLFGHALEVMQGLYENRNPRHKYVFEGRWQQPINIEYAWTQARQLAGIVDFHFHDLRHSTASYLAQQGASSVEIMEILGLKSIAMVKRYAHMSRLVTEQSVERMNLRLFNTAR